MFLPWVFFVIDPICSSQKSVATCPWWLVHKPVAVLYGFQAAKNGLAANSADVSGRLQSYVFNKMANGEGKRFIPLEERNPWLALFPLLFSLLTSPKFPGHSSCLLRVNDTILQHYSQLPPKSPCHTHSLESRQSSSIGT